MINITHKSPTLRKAIAQAIVKVSKPETILAVKNHGVPKGDVLEMAKTAGLFAAKRTADMIPDCHPLPIEFTAVSYELGEMEIKILVEIHTIYKTGVEVEAMHAASVVALTMYDMLKPLDKGISIEQIKLIEKRGGKSDQKTDFSELSAAVIVCSDSIAKGVGEDKSGKVIIGKLERFGIQVLDYKVIPDDSDQIQSAANDALALGIDILIYTGGTGLSPRDLTPESLEPLLDRRIPGIEEAIRSYGQQRVPTAMLSRSVAGTMGKMLVLALPGSVAGAGESMDAVFPAVLHSFKVLSGERH
ncbi:molybdenum cofactor biosynthesis protein MoaC [Algoriphagus alkaliphilus]|uniref:Molybdenum cofactor biosynthesis protein MoaC n=1 Tax=Algoriphagus alkaliphilus TaxID=279824 RepID=A0A1G5ZFW3_9BACT|nr:bifunctional molybdenum cofactor biosynthesis protein MoaC/MoaB [Algoriphagus alkaliphilus]MBA4298856.1 bifunctional molybdenum cofactor biosynthesis protein MoaC/MoaB [Cyclobacterium sp.]SDA93694.1 molybdenum cofactor biosynthesis protein MoaC [Algoriphagus alkaliphilus]